ncbi:MAG: DUF4172 domain-containing protein [Rhodocyclaceae bacterium]|nr:DUF4172 domain-containing protein [Rhodocyclaceae bacterium]
MWTWQHADWPNFSYDLAAFRDQVDDFRLKSERLIGRMEALPVAWHTDAVVGLMLSEAIKTSAIEGELLDRDSVRSSILRLIAEDSVAPAHKDIKALGAASLMVDVRKRWATPLDDELLGNWQSMVVVHQPMSLIMRGMYRNAPEPMQIVSGVYGHQTVYYEAPPAARVYEEMAQFLNGITEQARFSRKKTMSFLGRSAPRLPMPGLRSSTPSMMAMAGLAGPLLITPCLNLSTIPLLLVLRQRLNVTANVTMKSCKGFPGGSWICMIGSFSSLQRSTRRRISPRKKSILS